MVKDSTERCRGFGLITMANYEEAFAAVNTLNGASVNGRQIQVSYCSEDLGLNTNLF
jgi:RNA recognition motif-containing protein